MINRVKLMGKLTGMAADQRLDFLVKSQRGSAIKVKSGNSRDLIGSGAYIVGCLTGLPPTFFLLTI